MVPLHAFGLDVGTAWGLCRTTRRTICLHSPELHENLLKARHGKLIPHDSEAVPACLDVVQQRPEGVEAGVGQRE